jgi:ATP-dependent Clp protease ATP-binding subunit ClpB
MTDDTRSITRRRLEEIDRELADLRRSHADLRAQWETEKAHIQTLRQLKTDIEQVKQEAAEAERNGDYGRVAELRYGTLLDLERNLTSANSELSQLQQEQTLLKEEIDAEDIAEVVAKWTGIPVQRMLESERAKLLRMEDRLHERVIGQDDAVVAVSNAIRRSRAGLQDAKRPIGSFIFLGTTGVGKTEMARALAEFLFDDDQALVRIDMSEYMEKHAVSRLIGAPPGYVGYEEGGQLTEAVRRRPYCVVLLDEIEKAHADVFNVLLQVLDDGRLTDGQGRSVDFRNTIIIMTSNLGTDVMQDRLLEITEETRDAVMASVRLDILELLRKKLRPEFLNRIDEILLFKPLVRTEIERIAILQIDAVRARLANLGIKLDVTAEAMDWLARRGYDVQYGARPLKRVVQRYVSDPLAIKVLSADVRMGDTVVLDADENGQAVFTVFHSDTISA